VRDGEAELELSPEEAEAVAVALRGSGPDRAAPPVRTGARSS
jgi:hypothetical protein